MLYYSTTLNSGNISSDLQILQMTLACNKTGEDSNQIVIRFSAQNQSAIVSRLLPTMFLDRREHVDAVMVAVDFKNFFLTVKQQAPIIVICQLADGQTVNYSLGRVLPGQRDGSLLWHGDVIQVYSNLNLV